jgi:adenosine deaminase
LPSINISYGVIEAELNYELFKSLRENYPSIVVGIDLSGDPSKGKFADFKHIYEKARVDGFGLAIHCAEIDDEEEILEMLKFMNSNDRIGHGTFIDGEIQFVD